MPIRIKHAFSVNATGPEQVDPIMHETTVDGMTFAWGPGETRVIGDDGVAAAHAAFDNSAGNYVQEDNAASTLNVIGSNESRS